MKRHKWFNKKIAGFTLIELMLVISIIAILAGMLFAAVKGALASTKRAKAKTQIASLVTAARAYSNQYGYWPQTATTTAIVNSGSHLVRCFKGLDLVTNPKGIVFMDFSARDLIGSGTMQVLIDPFGRKSNGTFSPFWIYFDTNGDNWVSNPADSNVPTNLGSIAGGSIQGGVIVWSNGIDNSNNNGAGDDQSSWK